MLIARLQFLFMASFFLIILQLQSLDTFLQAAIRQSVLIARCLNTTSFLCRQISQQ